VGDDHEETKPVGLEESRQDQAEANHASLARRREEPQGKALDETEALREGQSDGEAPIRREQGGAQSETR
jgi:hypothetical protein